MKKHLSFTMNNQGFILFHVLFIISISLLLIMTSIEIYHNNIYIVDRQMEYVEYESLFQMGQVKLTEELKESSFPEEEITYLFPTGRVIIRDATLDTDHGIGTFFFIISFHESPDLRYYVHHRIPYTIDS